MSRSPPRRPGTGTSTPGPAMLRARQSPERADGREQEHHRELRPAHLHLEPDRHCPPGPPPRTGPPTRSVPAANDDAVFDNGAAFAIANSVPTQTVAQILVSGNTNITFTASTGRATVTLAGAGADLSVAAGSTLPAHGPRRRSRWRLPPAPRARSPAPRAGRRQHRLTAAGRGARSSIARFGDSSWRGLSTATRSAPRISTRSSSSAGSLYQHIAGANPFGATAPSSVVTFLPGKPLPSGWTDHTVDVRPHVW
jgi:hypothetical protein